MSFRKKGDVINAPPSLASGSRAPAISRTPQPLRGIGPARPAVPGRGVPGRGVPIQPGVSPATTSANLGDHPGVRPSILTSQPCVSTGASDLDKVLGHQGLPVGSSLLVEENGATDFSSTLLKLFVSQGIIQNRIDPKHPNTHTILVGHDQNWSKTLPGVYQGSSRERKKQNVQQNESKLSVSNIIDSQSQKPRQNDLKIAWRYGLSQQKLEKSENDTSSQYPHYNNQFEITSTLIPAPAPAEITCIPVAGEFASFQPVLKRIEETIKRLPGRLIRLVVPLFLNPMIYQDERLLDPKEAIKFLHGLRLLTRKYQDRIVVAVSINLDLYPRSSPLTSLIEGLVDSAIELRPFDPQLYDLMERVYRNQPAKIKHGHLNVIKVPVLSEIGLMCVQDMEYSFKNGRRRFEVEEFSIPVEEEDKETETTQGNQTRNIDF